MTPEASEPNLKWAAYRFFETFLLALNDWRELDPEMKETLRSGIFREDSTSSSARLEGIETRLSTLEAGLGKLIESHSIMLQQEEFRRQTTFS